MDYTALKTEIETDPLNLGYASRVAVGDDEGIATILNDRTGSGSAMISLATATKGEVLLGVTPVAFTLPSKSNAIQAKWGLALQLLAAATTDIPVSSEPVASMLAAAVSDGVLTQAQIDAFTKRRGSRAEVLFGVDTAVAHQDVAVALRG